MVKRLFMNYLAKIFLEDHKNAVEKVVKFIYEWLITYDLIWLLNILEQCQLPNVETFLWLLSWSKIQDIDQEVFHHLLYVQNIAYYGSHSSVFMFLPTL